MPNNNMQRGPKLLTPFQTARLAGVRPQMVYAYMNANKLPHIKHIRQGGYVRRMIEEEEAIAWADHLTAQRLVRAARRAAKLEQQLKGL